LNVQVTTIKKKEGSMLILIKTQVGMFMGLCSGEIGGDLMLNKPCIIDFIPVPIQGRIGQQSIGIIRSVAAWPERILMLKNLGSHAYSIVENPDSDFAKLYDKTINEAWSDNSQLS
jgi:hypothetical protein